MSQKFADLGKKVGGNMKDLNNSAFQIQNYFRFWEVGGVVNPLKISYVGFLSFRMNVYLEKNQSKLSIELIAKVRAYNSICACQGKRMVCQ